MIGKTNAQIKDIPSVKFWGANAVTSILTNSTTGSMSPAKNPTLSDNAKNNIKDDYTAYFGNLSISTSPSTSYYYINSTDSSSVQLSFASVSSSAIVRLDDKTLRGISIDNKNYVEFRGNRATNQCDSGITKFNPTKIKDEKSTKNSYTGYYETTYLVGRIRTPYYIEVFEDGSTNTGYIYEAGRYKLKWFFGAICITISSGNTYKHNGLILSDDFEDLIVDVDDSGAITFVSGPEKIPVFLDGAYSGSSWYSSRYLRTLFGVYQWIKQ